MADENQKEQINETNNPELTKEENVDVFLEAAKKVRKDSVSKAEFDKVVAERNKLTEYILEGGDGSDLKPKPEEKEPTKEELKAILGKENISNLEYAEAALKLRKIVIDEGGQDPFLPKSSERSITSADVEGAEKVATVLQECVDDAKGDAATFNFLFENRVKDSSPIISAKVKAMQNKGKKA